MNKNIYKVLGVTLGLSLIVGSGIGVALHQNRSSVAFAAKGDTVSDAALTLSNGTSATGSDNNLYIEWSMVSGKIVAQQLRGCASAAASGEAVFTAVSNSYISAPRAYRGHIFAFTATDDYMITNVTFTYASNYGGLGLIVGDTLNTSANLVTTKNKTTVTGAVGVVSDTTNYSAVQDTTNLTWTISVASSSGTSALYVQNYDNNNSTASTQLRPTAITISYIVGNEALEPDAVTVTGSSAMTVGTPAQFSAQCTNGGSAVGIGQDVTWSSSDATVLAVSSTGMVTPLKNGSANVIATSVDKPSVSGYLSVSVSGGKTNLAPQTVTANGLGMNTNTYATWNGYHAINGFVIQTNQVARQGNDYIQNEVVVTYEKFAFIFQKTNGYLRTATNVGANINKVIISGVSTTAPTLTVSGGSTIGATTTSSTVSSTGMIHTYTFSTPVTYVNIKENGTAAAYINSVTFEFVGGAETVNSLADYILGLIPDRSDVTGLCEGTNGNYEAAKTRYIAANATVRAEFQNSSDETVAAARERYVQWAAVYGDSTPFDTAYALSSRMPFANKNTSAIVLTVVLASVLLVTLGGYFLLRKKKEN